MSNGSRLFHFHVTFTGDVDRANGVIRGVSIITGNLVAEGHDLEVDDTTLSQLLSCASKTGQVPVNLDHQSGIKDTCGFLDNFRIDRGKLRGDWHLLKAHKEYDTTLERAERMPGCFGLSVKFKGKSEKKGPKAFARCDKLISVDCVTQPAANPDGLFSARVDSARRGMADPNSDPNAAPGDESMPAWAKQFLDRLEGIDQRLQAQEQFNQDVVQSLNEPSLDELAEMTDEELADLGLTRGEVESAVAEAAGGDNPGGGADAPAGEAEASAMSAGNRALREIHEFKAQMAVQARSEENASIAHAFSVVEEKVVALATLNDELTSELATKDAEITALRATLKTGGKRVAPGMDYALFSAKDKRAPAGSFEQLVTAKFEELKTSGTTELSAKSKAIDFCVRNHTDAYVEYRERGGKLKL